MNNPLVTVFGGSGFVGRYIVRRLAASGARVRVAVRDTEKAYFLKTCGDLGQVSLIPTSIGSDSEVVRAVEGADWVINTVGILEELGARTFQATHIDGAARVAKAATDADVKQLVHISALGADKEGASAYARSKAAGEEAVKAAFPTATILRPSVIFGPEDGFFNRFAELGRTVSVMPYFTNVNPHVEGGGGTRFQPVFVSDVAKAAETVLSDGSLGGKIYELGGRTVYDMRTLLDMINQYTDRKAWILGLPFMVGRLMTVINLFRTIMSAFDLLKAYLPPTLDQLKLLETDNVISGSHPGLDDLGIDATTVESVVPTYLRRFRPYQQQKKLRLDEG